MPHTVFIVLHALGGLAALVFGVDAVLPSRPQDERRASFAIFGAGLGLMTVSLLGALVTGGETYDGTERIVFPALFALALYMLYRARRAASVLGREPIGRRRDYIEHVGFCLISLFDGFMIVAAIDLGVPDWAVIAVAVAAVLVGVRVLAGVELRAERRGRYGAAHGLR